MRDDSEAENESEVSLTLTEAKFRKIFRETEAKVKKGSRTGKCIDAVKSLGRS